jgi:hypothetical protein
MFSDPDCQPEIAPCLSCQAVLQRHREERTGQKSAAATGEQSLPDDVIIVLAEREAQRARGAYSGLHGEKCFYWSEADRARLHTINKSLADRLFGPPPRAGATNPAPPETVLDFLLSLEDDDE